MLHLKQDLVQVIAPFNDHITGTNQWSFLTKQYVTDKLRKIYLTQMIKLRFLCSTAGEKYKKQSVLQDIHNKAHGSIHVNSLSEHLIAALIQLRNHRGI